MADEEDGDGTAAIPAAPEIASGPGQVYAMERQTMKYKIIEVAIAVPEDEAQYYTKGMIDDNIFVQRAPITTKCNVRNPNNEEKKEITRQRRDYSVSWQKPKAAA